MKLSIIIPAHNEQDRIGRMLNTYGDYFNQQESLTTEFIVVLNGCTDNTLDLVTTIQNKYPQIRIINLPESGKGLAITAGFADAITRDNHLVGFVDADMATQPQHFHALINQIGEHGSIIASRYMPESHIEPKRPFVKTWGRKLVYHTLIRALFGLNFYDYQCGAKLFKAHVIKKIAPHLTMQQWAFDVEILYLCNLFKFTTKEVPTTWFDQAGSKLQLLGPGTAMLSSLFTLRKKHKNLNSQ